MTLALHEKYTHIYICIRTYIQYIYYNIIITIFWIKHQNNGTFPPINSCKCKNMSITSCQRYLGKTGFFRHNKHNTNRILINYLQKVSLSDVSTPWKINTEPTNHPFRKENDLPNLHEYVPAVNLQGCKSLSFFFFGLRIRRLYHYPTPNIFSLRQVIQRETHAWHPNGS